MTQTSQNAKNHPLPCDRCPCSLTYRSKSNFTAYPLSSDDRSAHPLSSFDRSVHLLSSYDRSSLWLTETVIATSGAMRRCWVITKASWRRLRIWSTNLSPSVSEGIESRSRFQKAFLSLWSSQSICWLSRFQVKIPPINPTVGLILFLPLLFSFCQTFTQHGSERPSKQQGRVSSCCLPCWSRFLSPWRSRDKIWKSSQSPRRSRNKQDPETLLLNHTRSVLERLGGVL